MAVIREFIVGSCRHPECIAIKGGRFTARDFPARAYLIEAGNERILWDTGYSSHFLQETRGVYGLYRLVTPVSFDPRHALVKQLANIGVTPDSLAKLVVSHFHADHISGLADFPGVPVYASEAAWDSIDGLSGLRSLAKAHIPALLPSAAAQERLAVERLEVVDLPHCLLPFQQGFALTRDHSVLAVHLPGHAQGHLGAFVKTSAGWELIASDAAWDVRAYTELSGPSELAFLVQDNRNDYYATLERLRQLHKKGIPIRLSHEPRGVLNA